MNALISVESQIADYKKTKLDPRYRLDLLYYLITKENTIGKNKSIINLILSKGYEDPYKICIETLNLYDTDKKEEIKAPPSGKYKINITDVNDLEKICKVLQVYIKNIPEEKISILEYPVITEIIYNLMNVSKIIKYKRYGFFILVHYMDILAKRNEIDEHNVKLY